MTHLTEERLTTVAFQSAQLTAIETAHLEACETCRRDFDALTQLADEIGVLRQSLPDPAALQRYYHLFEQAPQREGGIKARLQELAAVLSWDSRQQVAMAGVRSVTASEYRLLYSTESVEVELMVEIDGPRRHLEGDLIPLTEQALTPALLQLHALDDPDGDVREIEIGGEIGSTGRFRFQDLRPGRYRFTVTTMLDLNITVDELDIT